MRDNGLNAASWVLLADVDPRVADAALDALRNAGVAAYTDVSPVSPAHRPAVRRRGGSRAGRGRAARAAAAGARRSGQRLAYDPAEVDAEFARIIAGMDSTAPERGEPPTQQRDSETGSDATTTTTGWEIVGSARHDVEDQPGEAADEEHFVPPPPPPVPRGDAISRFAWLGLIGAPVLTLLCVLMNWRLEGWQALLVAGAFIGGFATLVIRMGNGDDDDDPDGGAVV